MDDRFDHMQASIDSLTESLEELQERVAHLEGAAVPETSAAMPVTPGVAVDAPEAPSEGLPVVHVFSVSGTAFLVLAGAFLLRSFTEAGALAPLTGVALGIAYAVAWMIAADRAGARGSTLTASFLGVSAVLIAYPLLWEATTKLGALSRSSRPVSWWS